MSISRRKFLGWMGAAGAGVTVGTSANAATGKHFKGYPDSFGVLHDITACVGCRECEAACNKVNELPQPDKPFNDTSVLDEKRRETTKAYTVVNKYPEKKNSENPVFRKQQCNHCLEPACASVCFVTAFSKQKTGPVVYDPTVCVGCRYCMIACPFEVPSYEYDNAFTPVVVKCTMCAPRIEKGLLPGCVEACPKEALTFGKRDDLIKIARKRIEKHPDKYIDHIYGENEMGGTSWLYISGVPFNEVGLREDLGETPAPALTSGALHVVPMIVGIWPTFLAGMYGMTKRRERIAAEEKANAVAEAIEKTNEEAGAKLAQAMEKAKQDKEKALAAADKARDKAVHDALERAAAEAKPAEEES